MDAKAVTGIILLNVLCKLFAALNSIGKDHTLVDGESLEKRIEYRDLNSIFHIRVVLKVGSESEREISKGESKKTLWRKEEEQKTACIEQPFHQLTWVTPRRVNSSMTFMEKMSLAHFFVKWLRL